MKTTNPLIVICIVKENICRASEMYAKTATKINTFGRNLFEQLSEFEKFHYDRLSALEQSLRDEAKFISSGGKEFVLPPILGKSITEAPDRKSRVQIISEAMQLEKQAERAFANVAVQIPDPQGQELFARLSKEERKHYDILMEAFWSVNQTGDWEWSPLRFGKVSLGNEYDHTF